MSFKNWNTYVGCSLAWLPGFLVSQQISKDFVCSVLAQIQTSRSPSVIMVRIPSPLPDAMARNHGISVYKYLAVPRSTRFPSSSRSTTTALTVSPFPRNPAPRNASKFPLSFFRSQSTHTISDRAAMASADILSQTLASITTIKLGELSSQRSNFEHGKTKLLDDVRNEPDQRQKLEILLKRIESLPVMGRLNDNLVICLKNLKQFLYVYSRNASTQNSMSQTQWDIQKAMYHK